MIYVIFMIFLLVVLIIKSELSGFQQLFIDDFIFRYIPDIMHKRNIVNTSYNTGERISIGNIDELNNNYYNHLFNSYKLYYYGYPNNIGYYTIIKSITRFNKYKYYYIKGKHEINMPIPEEFIKIIKYNNVKDLIS